MLRVLQSPLAVGRIAGATEFIRGFHTTNELVLVGSSREAIDDLVRGIATAAGCAFTRLRKRGAPSPEESFAAYHPVA
jgi:ribosomal protein S2